jgi:pyrroline-5-carboxylate reductase
VKQAILLVGAGRMGGALLHGWLSKDLATITVVEPDPQPELRELARSRRITLVDNIEGMSSRPGVCVIALKPQVLREQAPRFRSFVETGTLMLSIAAGTTTAAMLRAWGRKARIVRAMPNTPGAIGHGISALYARRNVSLAERKLAQSLLSALGETLWVGREALIDSVTAVSGSGPAYVFLLVEALVEAARYEGLSKVQAEKLARATVSGAGALIEADDRSASELRQDVTSPGGTTEAALDVLLASNGLKPLIARAVCAARKRAEELGR